MSSIFRALVLGVVTTAALIGSPAQAAAQAPATNVAVSYGILHDSDIGDTFPAGWLLAVSRDVNPMFGLVGEVGGNYNTMSVFGTDVSLRVHSLLGGVRVHSSRSARAAPFAQVVAGLARAGASALGEGASVNGLAIQPGGGVDLQVSSRVGLRVQGDYRIIRSEGDTSNEFRFAVGLVFGVGRQ